MIKAKKDKFKLFKKLQKLDRAIGKIDRDFSYQFKLWPRDLRVKTAKLRREKLDLQRTKARIERKQYGIKPQES
jgi:hypothetical protein